MEQEGADAMMLQLCNAQKSPVLTCVHYTDPAAPRHKQKAQQISQPGAAIAELHLLNLQLCIQFYSFSNLISVLFQQNSSHVSYSNIMESEEEAGRAMISRSFQLEVHFSCIYAYEQVVRLPFSLTAVDK